MRRRPSRARRWVPPGCYFERFPCLLERFPCTFESYPCHCGEVEGG